MIISCKLALYSKQQEFFIHFFCAGCRMKKSFHSRLLTEMQQVLRLPPRFLPFLQISWSFAYTLYCMDWPILKTYSTCFATKLNRVQGFWLLCSVHLWRPRYILPHFCPHCIWTLQKLHYIMQRERRLRSIDLDSKSMIWALERFMINCKIRKMQIPMSARILIQEVVLCTTWKAFCLPSALCTLRASVFT